MLLIAIVTSESQEIRTGNMYRSANISINCYDKNKANNTHLPMYLKELGFKIPLTKQAKIEVFRKYYRRIAPPVSVDCQRIVAGDARAVQNTTNTYKNYKRLHAANESYLNSLDCDSLRKRGYIDHPLTEEELEFPLAFGILVYKEFEQVERLLRAIYRPQNQYCIHVDQNNTVDTEKTYDALNNISNCFHNVYVVPDRIDVKWGEYSILEAEFKCLEHLWKAKGWKYYINLTGQEFPLKTNLEIVKILKAMDGANVVYGMKTR